MTSVRVACLALLLSACSSLPTIDPGRSPRGDGAVPVTGARGPLSAARSKAILDRLKSRGEPTGIFDRHLAIEEAIAAGPLTAGNRVRLLKDGPATFQAMLSAIAAATDHVNVETYILDDDAIGRRFAAALIERQRAGVQVNLIRDSVGTFGTPAAYFQELADAGIRVLEFNPVNPLAAGKSWELNQRDHRKLLIVDGRIAFLGGINISGVYSGGSTQGTYPRGDSALAWRDTDIELEGPAVAELQKLFLATWERQGGAPLASRAYLPPPESPGREVVRIIASSPEDEYSLIYATLLSAIASAESSVRVTNAYFVPDPQLLEALERAAARGVDVVLVLPGQTDSWLALNAGRSYFGQLLRAGVKIYERRGVILHAKTVLVDGVWATIGSTNLDWRSFLHNHELNAVVLGTVFGAQVQDMFEQDRAASDPVTLEAWERRALGQRIKEWIGRLWKYWL